MASNGYLRPSRARIDAAHVEPPPWVVGLVEAAPWLGVADDPRLRWFRSAAELCAHLTVHPAPTVVLDAQHLEADRDLVQRCGALGASVIVVDRSRRGDDWRALGACDVVRNDDALRQAIDARHPRPCSPPSNLGPLVTVVGTGPTAALVAPLVASSLPAPGHVVVLADLTRTGRLRSLHPGPPGGVGLQDLVHGARRSTVPPSVALAMAVPQPARGYRLLAGLRHPTDWITLGPRSTAAALDAVRAGPSTTLVLLADPDLDGEAETGSTEIEDRHQLARLAVGAADLTILVGDPSPPGLHDLALLERDALEQHRPDTRALTVVAGERPRTVGPHLTIDAPSDPADPRWASTVGRLRQPVATALVAPTPRALWRSPEPERLAPGELGHWPDPAGAPSISCADRVSSARPRAG